LGSRPDIKSNLQFLLAISGSLHNTLHRPSAPAAAAADSQIPTSPPNAVFVYSSKAVRWQWQLTFRQSNAVEQRLTWHALAQIIPSLAIRYMIAISLVSDRLWSQSGVNDLIMIRSWSRQALANHRKSPTGFILSWSTARLWELLSTILDAWFRRWSKTW